MAYGSVLTDVVQSSTAGTPPQFNDGNGTQTGTLCRAWVNFNGTGTVAIRASFNVSSITDNGTGKYTINFTNAFSDANYCVTGAQQANLGTGQTGIALQETNPTTTACAIQTTNVGVGTTDSPYVCAAFFR